MEIVRVLAPMNDRNEFASDVDRDVDTGGQIQLLQLVDRLRGRLDDVDEALVRPGLELLHRLFVDVWRTVDREFFDARRQRNWAGDASAGALGGLDNILRRLIDDTIVEALKFDANSLAFHGGKRTGGLRARRRLGGGLDDFREERIRHLFKVRRRNAGAGTALRKGTNVGHITEQHFERNERVDDTRAGLVLDALDLATTAIDVAHEVALVLFRRGDFDAHDGFEE